MSASHGFREAQHPRDSEGRFRGSGRISGTSTADAADRGRRGVRGGSPRQDDDDASPEEAAANKHLAAVRPGLRITKTEGGRWMVYSGGNGKPTKVVANRSSITAALEDAGVPPAPTQASETAANAHLAAVRPGLRITKTESGDWMVYSGGNGKPTKVVAQKPTMDAALTAAGVPPVSGPPKLSEKAANAHLAAAGRPDLHITQTETGDWMVYSGGNGKPTKVVAQKPTMDAALSDAGVPLGGKKKKKGAEQVAWRERPGGPVRRSGR